MSGEIKEFKKKMVGLGPLTQHMQWKCMRIDSNYLVLLIILNN